MTAPQQVFVTGVANPTHLVYVASYLRQLLAAGPVEVVTPRGERIDPTEPAVRALLPDDPGLQVRRGTDWTCPAERAIHYVAVGAPGLKAYARLHRANPRRRIPVVVTDEGLGTYGTWRTRRAAWGRQGVAEPWRTVRSLAVATGGVLFTSRRWPLYVRRTGTWAVVDAVAEEFRRRVAPRVPENAAGRRVVLLTQPWIELGVTPERAYLGHVTRLAEQIDAAGGELVVRAHPLERPQRYAAFTELDARLPAELTPEIVHAAAVVGGPSTALLNLAAVHGVPTVRVGVPGRPDLDAEVSRAQSGLLGHFLGPIVAEDDLARHLDLR